MEYDDPRTGKERNLGQDDVGSSTWSWIGGLVILAAVAYGGWYFYDHGQKSADLNQPSASTAENATPVPNSGPGVQGAAGSTNGPAAEKPDAGSATGASSGSSGTGNIDPATQPSQDATGVKGAAGSTNGPAESNPKQ